MVKLFCLIFCALTGLLATVGAAGPQVLTTHGIVEGSIMSALPTGRSFYSFRGIPYAKPPVGKLRFRPPKNIEPWQGVLDATRDAPMCIQLNTLLPTLEVQGQEDCLYLNVYTPQILKDPKDDELLPVMVYIYGGGFFSGTSHSAIYGPEYLMTKDVVLVTFNYRVGPMGFLSSGTTHAPGNAGLKDQAAVLKWVRGNAEAFGGDFSTVTIFGQSSGGASVHYHMLSPMSRGLFSRAIAQSGTALSVWSWGSTQGPGGVSLAPSICMAQATYVNCPTEDTESMITCLQNVDAQVLVNSTLAFQVWDRDPLVIYAPVIESTANVVGDEEFFLTEDPFKIISDGRINSVPFMLGVVPSEGTVRGGAILSNQVLVDDYNSRVDYLGPLTMGLVMSVKNGDYNLQKEVYEKLADFYLGSQPLSKENERGFIDMHGDRLFTHSVYHTATMHSDLELEPVFLYQFSYEGQYSYTPLFSHNPNASYGVGHCDELIYLFRSPALFPPWQEGHPDTKMRDTMIDIWTNFATNGVPTVTGGNPVWRPLSTCAPLHYANLTVNVTTGNMDFFRQRMEFWESLALLENVRTTVYFGTSSGSVTCGLECMQYFESMGVEIYDNYVCIPEMQHCCN